MISLFIAAVAIGCPDGSCGVPRVVVNVDDADRVVVRERIRKSVVIIEKEDECRCPRRGLFRRRVCCLGGCCCSPSSSVVVEEKKEDGCCE